MMNSNEEEVDLGLALGSSSFCIQARLNNTSGAGVNANLGARMAFAASDPLSELVWSPHSGLSLKCTGSRLADKKPFLLWNVGLSNEAVSTSVTIESKMSGDDKLVDEENLIISRTMDDANAKLVIVDKASFIKSPRSRPGPDLESNGKLKEEAENLYAQEEDNKDSRKEDLCKSKPVQEVDVAESDKVIAEQDVSADGNRDCKDPMDVDRQSPTRRKCCHENSKPDDDTCSSNNMGSEAIIPSEPLPHVVMRSENLVCSSPSLLPRCEPDEGASATGEINKIETEMPSTSPPFIELEFSAENHLGNLSAKEAHSIGAVRVQRENSLPAERSLTNCRTSLHQEKGKAKALSERETYLGLYSGEDNSRESVESCNSARLVSGRLKRQRGAQEPMVESKRMKIQENQEFTSVDRPDSSFMNWISNMVKGLSDYTKEEHPPVPLTVAHPDDFCSKNHQKNPIHNRAHDSASPNKGFHTVFESLYCQREKSADPGMQKEDNQASRDFMASYKASLANLLVSRNRNEYTSGKQIPVSDKDVNCHISGNVVGQPRQADIACHSYACESVKNIDSGMPVHDKAKINSSLFDTLCKQENITADNASLSFPLEASNWPEKSNPLASLWITRLYTRTHRLENCMENNQEAPEFQAECPKDNIVFTVIRRSSWARDHSAEDQTSASKEKLHAEASVELNSTSRLSPLQPPQKSQNSEAMASVFARRLDALRHISQPERRNYLSCTSTCFFCGISGHNLRQCPNVTESELEQLQVKISSFDCVEEPLCVCIRCYQLNHWVISCPFVTSSKLGQSARNASCFSHHAGNPVKLCVGCGKCSSYLTAAEIHKQLATGCTAGNCQTPCLGSSPTYPTWNAKFFSSKQLSTSDEIQKSASSNSDDFFKNNHSFPLCESVAAYKVVPQEMFHAIRRLRLSRADILRWMNSTISISHLTGFYLRLRLGKYEAGLGETGYLVACITGDMGEHIGSSSNKSILVDVGGVKSTVRSRYVSNHEFQKDEINFWWSRIVKSGGKVPSIDELNSKIEDRKNLCF